MLILGEHPEYHDMPGGLELDFVAVIDATGLIDEAEPQTHVITHAIVATQLWHDDPPQAWQATQRLTAASDVLYALGDVVTQHPIKGTSTQQELAGNESYRRDLDSLGRPPLPAKRHRPVATP